MYPSFFRVQTMHKLALSSPKCQTSGCTKLYMFAMKLFGDIDARLQSNGIQLKKGRAKNVFVTNSILTSAPYTHKDTEFGLGALV